MKSSQTKKKAGRVLALDTSNYTTSAAVSDLKGNLLADCRKLLTVKEGERGLRQSHALFQHVENLPALIKEAMNQAQISSEEICAVAVSEKPRPVEGSYMPVFRAGVSMAESMGAVLGVPVYRFSHQEGHIAAVCGVMEENKKTVSFHMSGGTGEILLTQGCRPVSIIGGTRDLSFGQLIDRAGVALGLGFPAGAALDRIVCDMIPLNSLAYSSRGNTKIENPAMKSIHVEETYTNLSGIETQILREIQRLKKNGILWVNAQKRSDTAGYSGEEMQEGTVVFCRASDREEVLRLTAQAKHLAAELFCRIADALIRLSVNSLKTADADTIIFVGGVSASAFLRGELSGRLKKQGFHAVFGEPRMSPDNACGIARLGAAAYLKNI